MMSNFELPFESPPSEKQKNMFCLKDQKPQVVDTEMKVKCLIMDIEKRVDKNSKDYWIIRTRLDKNTTRDYLAFSQDYQLAPKALSLLMNYSYQLVNDWVVLTVKKNNDREKVIRIEK